MLSLTSLLVLVSVPAAARCRLAALETRLEPAADATRWRRVDRWSWSVGPGPVDCQALDFASPSAAPIVDLQVAVDRLDGRDPRIGPDRIVAVAEADDPGFGDAAGLRVFVPEVQPGDVVEVEVARDWPRQPRFDWRPGARGGLQIATLAVPEGVEVALAGGELPPASLTRGTRSWWLEEAPASPPEPMSDGVAGASGGQWRHGIALLLPERKPLRGLGDDKRSAALSAWRQDGGAPLRVAPPREALLRWCEQGDGTPCADVGGVAWRIDPTAGARWGWVLPGSWPSGEVVAPAGVDGAQVVVSGPAGRLSVQGGTESTDLGELVPSSLAAGGLGALLDGYAPVETEVARALSPGDRLQWTVAELDGASVLPDRRAAEQLVARLAVEASVPEPGVGAAFRGRKRDPGVIAEVLDVLRTRMQAGRLPGQPDLAPRKLLRARRSGWGSPWELALVLTRYLRQLKLDAVPLPVRPASMGEPMPAATEGWPGAVVSVDLPGGDTVWVDPSCPTCAVGQLLPSLDAAWVLSPGLDRLPALPLSRWERFREGDELIVEVEGPLAVALRREVLGWPAAERAARLAERFGGPGATLAEHEGVTEPADRIRLRLSGASQPPAPTVLGSAAPAGGIAPVRGVWRERVLLDAASAVSSAVSSAPITIEAPGLRWSRGVRDGAWVEELVVEQHELDPAAATAVFARVGTSWGRVPAQASVGR